jgi:hypothetical protein
MASKVPTYGQLDGLLLRLGFDRQTFEQPLPGSKRKQTGVYYEHHPSGTIIVLHDAPPTTPVRPVDALSAQLHLVQNGLISEAEWEQMLTRGTGGKPLASAKRKNGR